MMHSLSLLTTILFASISSATPIHPSDSIPGVTTWTASEVSRSHSQGDTACWWHMKIGSSNPFMAETSSPSTETTPDVVDEFDCVFQVVTTPGNDCRLKEFRDGQCARDGFIVGGGDSGLGFMVVVVYDTNEHVQAYFGFDDAALDSGAMIPATTSLVEKTVNAGSDLIPFANAVDPVGKWAVEDGTRHIDNAGSMVHLSFKINTMDNTTPKPCKLDIAYPKGTNLKASIFANKKCVGSDYIISWGYMEGSDDGVMTIVSPKKDAKTWFGFARVNDSEKLVAGGPSAVYPCKC